MWLLAVLLANPFNSLAKNDRNITRPETATACFIENKGQLKDEHGNSRNDIDYKLNSNGGFNIFVRSGALYYQWNKNVSGKKNSGAAIFYRMDIELAGANTHIKPLASDIQNYRENYYTGGLTGTIVHSFGKIVYQNIYPNIDWVIYATAKTGVKYEFIVHPGGNPKQIKMHYTGADGIKIADGAVVVTNEFGSITEQKPYCYTLQNKEEIPSAFIQSNNNISFDIASYTGTLIIDPSLSWGTYFGNVSNTEGNSIVTDSVDNTYLGGKTFSTSNIVVSTTASQVAYGGGNSDAYIIKFNQGGTPIWSTYWGAADVDAVTAVAYDKSTNGVIAGGYTNSPSNSGLGIIATPGAFQSINGGTGFSGSTITDAILAKFDDTGKLVWGTFFGGTQTDIINAVACDQSGNIYIGGSTESPSGIHTSGTFRSALAPGFLAKFNPNGTRAWGTYFCGTVNAVTLDGNGRIYIAGTTDSSTGVTTTGSHMASFIGGPTDAFIAKFNSSGGRIWASYYGGTGAEESYALVTDSFRNVYLGGSTYSASGIATTGSFHPTHAAVLSGLIAIADGFLVKFDSSGSRKWGTYFGDSTGIDAIKSMVLGPDNKIYIAGVTGSLTTIATPGAYNSAFSGPAGIYMPPAPPPPSPANDIFLTKFSPAGERLWGTYIGGSGGDFSPSVAYGKGKVYVSGSTSSASGIATTGPPTPYLPGYQQTIVNSGTILAFVQKFNSDTSAYFRFPYTDTVLCAGDSLKVYYKITNFFITNNNFRIQLSDSSGLFTSTSPIIGTVADYREGVIACRIPPTTYEGTKYYLRILASNPKDTFYNYDVKVQIYRYHVPDLYANPNPACENDKVNFNDYNFPPAPNYTWIGPGGWVAPPAASVFRDTIKLSQAGRYIVIADNHGCMARDTVDLVVNPSPVDPVVSGDTSLCVGDSLMLHAATTTPGVSYAWLGPAPDYKTSTDQDFKLPTSAFTDSGYYAVVIYTTNGCPSNQFNPNARKKVTVHPLPNPTATNNTPLCQKDTVKLYATDTVSTPLIYKWTGPQSFSSNSKDTFIANSTTDLNGTYTMATTTIHGCSASSNTIVTVKPLPLQVDAVNNSPICSGTSLLLNANNGTAGASYSWTGPDGYSSNQQNPVLTNTTVTKSGVYTVVVDLNGCKKSDTTTVLVNKIPPQASLSSNSPVHVGDQFIKITIGNSQSDVNYSWTGPNSFTSTSGNLTLNSVVKAMGGKYVLVSSIATCSVTDSITIDVLDNPTQQDKDFIIKPIPNKGIFQIVATVETDNDIPLNIYTSDGKLVHSQVIKSQNKKVDETIDISGKVATGVYRLKIRVDGKTSTYNLLISQ